MLPLMFIFEVICDDLSAMIVASDPGAIYFFAGHFISILLLILTTQQGQQQ